MAAPKTSPAIAEIIAAAKALQPPTLPPEERGLAKHASTVIVSLILALVLWVGATIYSLNATTVQVSTKLDAMGKALDGMSAAQAQSSQRIADLGAAQAKSDQRLTSIEDEQKRMRERIRAVEGQAPLPSNREREE